MRDDSSPPSPATRSRFDSELARAMSDVPLPAGLTERLQTAVKASAVQSSNAAISPCRANHWSRRLMLSVARLSCCSQYGAGSDRVRPR